MSKQPTRWDNLDRHIVDVWPGTKRPSPTSSRTVDSDGRCDTWAELDDKVEAPHRTGILPRQ